MVKSRQKFPNRGGVQKNQKFPKFKNFPSKGGGSQNLGTVPKLYLVINNDVFPKSDNQKLQVLQNKVLRIISKAQYDLPTVNLLSSTIALSVQQLTAFTTLISAQKAMYYL